ncbi:MarR family winged helix-turn-helix transcriptional regulator [Limnohabitans radicicola]|uniref:MarR family transcriptional regulator n=1 Tax=Limnohabitans radicicola TaxID=2771427 RepID=A0A927FED2_9BURK|nr:MarR family transcriptional regulator [Limnohabitans radicicola]MBD8049052.1 MarR family transcriptional regulator [Limnohabitans radicicola]
MTRSFDFAQAPGHLIRRAQQIAVAEFARVLVDFDITPVQFALLNAVIDAPGGDQVTLAKAVAFDPATSGSVIARLEAKGWLRRQADAQDRRRKLLFVTPAGTQAVVQMSAAVSQVQKNILAPLSASEQVQFLDLLARLVAGHEQQDSPRDLLYRGSGPFRRI